jgi:5-methylcytosine-specific restriction endonuclease McrA
MSSDNTTIPGGYKKCSKCGELIPDISGAYIGVRVIKCLDCNREYHRKKTSEWRKRPENIEKVRSKDREYYWQHRNKRNEECKARHKRNRVAIAEYERQYKKARRSQINLRTKAYRDSHQEVLRKARADRYANPEIAARLRENNRRWRINNIEKSKMYDKAKHAKRRDAVGEFSSSDIELMLRQQKEKCYWCGKPLNGEYHVDHRIPLSKGGKNDPSNIVISCPHCNLSKGAKMPWEWIGRLL